MYARTSFRGIKTCKIGKKGVFGHIDKFWKGQDGQIKKNACKNAYLGSIFIREKYVFRVCFESPFTRMISSLKYKCPPWGVGPIFCKNILQHVSGFPIFFVCSPEHPKTLKNRSIF